MIYTGLRCVPVEQQVSEIYRFEMCPVEQQVSEIYRFEMCPCRTAGQ